PPMTLDRVVICIVGVPISGIAIFRASTRQFVLWDRELVALPGLDHDFAAFVLADLAGNRAAEVAVAQPVENNLAETVESLTELRPAGLAVMGMEEFLKHCAEAPSYL